MNKDVDLRLEDRETMDLKVCNILRKAILQGDFEPGERLVQEELANLLGVSRMPVREALRKLEGEGLIKLVPHRGAIVKSLTVEDVEEIYALRSNLEKIAIGKSIGKMKPEDINKLERLVSEMKKASDAQEFVETNIEFHRMLMKYCTWNRLLSVIETLWNGFPQQTPHMLKGQMELSNKEHDAILQAVKEKDAYKAAELVSDHITRTGEALIESIRQSKNEQNSLLQRTEK